MRTLPGHMLTLFTYFISSAGFRCSPNKTLVFWSVVFLCSSLTLYNGHCVTDKYSQAALHRVLVLIITPRLETVGCYGKQSDRRVCDIGIMFTLFVLLPGPCI